MTSDRKSDDQETVIGVDTASEQPTVNLFMTMQSKLDLLTSEANKMAKAESSANEAPTAQVAAQEQCRRIVVDLQDIAKKLAKTKHRFESLDLDTWVPPT